MSTSNDPDLIGQLLDGRYRLERLLDEGGMGGVWLAEDRKLGRQVVVKMPHTDLLRKEGFRERFERETRSLITLELPGVVRVLDVGRHGEVPFFVLQFLGGGNLKHHIQQKEDEKGLVVPQTPHEVARWLLPLARIMDRVHERNVVHRDIKPANVLFDHHGELYLADFGIAKALGAEDTGLTMTGQTPGTPRYMAPECWSGTPLGPPYDQYALGVMVYEALTSDIPHYGPSAQSILGQRQSVPAPLVHTKNPALSVALSKVVARCLAIDPSRRYATCTAFADAFARRVAESAAPTRRRWQVPAVSVVLVLLVAGFAYKTFTPASDSASRGEVAEAGDSPVAQAVATLLGSAESQLDAERWDEALRLLDDAAAAGADPEALKNKRTAALIGRGRARLDRGELDQAAEDSRQADQLRPSNLQVGDLRLRVTTALEDRLRTSLSDPIPPPDAWLKDRSTRLSVSVTEHVAAILVDGQRWTPSSGTVEGTWLAPDDGTHRIQATLVDRHDTELELEPWTVRVDTTAPTVTLPAEPPGTTAASIEITLEVEDRLSGVASVRIGAQEATYVSDLGWRATVPLELGPQLIVVGATDRAGNPSPETTFHAVRSILDTTAPVIRLTTPARESDLWHTIDGERTFVTSADSLTIAGQLDEEASLSLEGEPLALDGQHRFSADLPLASDGLRVFELIGRDLADNETRSLQLRVLRDTTDPSLSVSLDFGEPRRPGPLQLSGTVDDATATTVHVNGNAMTIQGDRWSGTVDLVEAEGKIPLLLEARDLAGNLVTRRETVTLATLGTLATPGSLATPGTLSIKGLRFLRVNDSTGKEEYIHEQTGVELVLIPGGTFTMGSPVSEPDRGIHELQRRITLSAFLIAKYELSQEQWTRLGRAHADLHVPDWDPPDPDLPAESISWDDCRAWLERTSPRLRFPSEAQWEYACRAGSAGSHCLADAMDSLAEYGWFLRNSGSQLLPPDSLPFDIAELADLWEESGLMEALDLNGLGAGEALDEAAFLELMRGGDFDGGILRFSKLTEDRLHQEWGCTSRKIGKLKPNFWGLHDMHGNVSEWCEDWYAEYDSSAGTDPRVLNGPGSGHRVYRGGSWAGSAQEARSACRGMFPPGGRVGTLGVRPAMLLASPPDHR